MQAQQLKQFCETPTIVCMSVCKHYLIEDFDMDNVQPFQKSSGRQVFKSLHDAKQYLRNYNVVSVNLTFQSENVVTSKYAVTMKL